MIYPNTQLRLDSDLYTFIHGRQMAYTRLMLCAFFCLQFFEDAQITEMFDQLSSYEILLDLLYDRRMYGDVLRINDDIRKRIASQNRYASKAMNAIIFATYYRLVRARVHTHTCIHYIAFSTLSPVIFM